MNVEIDFLLSNGTVIPYFRGAAGNCPPIPRINEQIQGPGGIATVQGVRHVPPAAGGPPVIRIGIVLG